MKVFARKTSSNDIWTIRGSFGFFYAELKDNAGVFSAQNEKIYVESKTEKFENGVFVRQGKIKNISDEEITINVMSSKFTFDGGEYEVYSQYNGWQNESTGGWQKLVTGVCASSGKIRNANGASPFMVLWSEQANRGTAFHMNAFCAWEMNISKKYLGSEWAVIEAEFGVFSDGLCIKLAPCEEIALPEIIYYTVFNKVDADCFKLHSYLNKKYPRKQLPVIYNTWLYKFDRFTFDDIAKQIEKAAMLGVEYFVIDAGWFGVDADWWKTRGDWQENMNFGFRGRMTEIAEKVRANGMKFGLWLEIETAVESSEAMQNHPDFYIKADGHYLVDFANKDALEFVFDKTCKVIEKYGVEFIKFDFNDDTNYDKYGTAFINYFKGQTEYIRRLKEKYPDIYLENCASGGMRMTARDGALYDSFWISDNQSPYFGIRIFKDTIKRMCPQWIECWAALRSVKDIAPIYATDDYSEKLISAHDATWDDVIGVEQSFVNGFLTGSPVGLSFDLTALSEKTFGEFKKFIDEFKKKRDFYKDAVCHILCDVETVVVLEYRNEDFSQIELVIFSFKTKQNNICVYPVLDKNSNYTVGERVLSGEQIFENGIDIAINRCHSAQVLTLKKEI